MSSDAINHQIRCDPLTSELMKHPDGIYSQQALQHDYLCTIHLKHPQHDTQQGHHLPMTTLTAGSGNTTTTPCAEDPTKGGIMCTGSGAIHSGTSGIPIGPECIGMHPVMTTKRGDHVYELPRFPYPDMCPTTVSRVQVQSVDSIPCVGVDGCDSKELRNT